MKRRIIKFGKSKKIWKKYGKRGKNLWFFNMYVTINLEKKKGKQNKVSGVCNTHCKAVL